jgi:hypothetical protein
VLSDFAPDQTSNPQLYKQRFNGQGQVHQWRDSSGFLIDHPSSFETIVGGQVGRVNDFSHGKKHHAGHGRRFIVETEFFTKQNQIWAGF